MKSVKYILPLAATMTLAGCFNDFLDRPAQNVTPEVEVNDIVKMNNSIYSTFLSYSDVAGDALYSMGEIASDNALRGSILSDQGGIEPSKQYNQFQNFYGLGPTSINYIRQLWEAMYPGVSQANVNIRAIERLFPDADSTLKVAMMAEDRFVRAWYYMVLVNFYGEVVLLPEGDATPGEYAELTNDKSVTELYDYILADLNYAAENLPTKAQWQDKFKIDWKGRAHNGSAKGYLAKALLYQAANLTWTEGAASQARTDSMYSAIVDIVKSMEADYSLYPNYEQIFRPEGNYNVESLFEVGTKSTADGTTAYKGWRRTQPRNAGGTGCLAPSMNLINQYERDADGKIIDTRYYGTVLQGAQTPLAGMVYEGTSSPMRKSPNGEVINGVPGGANASITARGWPNRFCRKCVQPKPEGTDENAASNLGGANLKFLRWGEVLLIGAEAAYYTGDEATARRWLKMVRSRAGLDASPLDVETLTGQPLLDQIWKDKRLEIALEWSNRYWEMVRIDKIHPGYMKSSFSAKINDELNAIYAYLTATSQWGAVNAPEVGFPMTPDNYRTVMPLRDGLQVPRNYTMPISSAVFQTMLNIKQTKYYR